MQKTPADEVERRASGIRLKVGEASKLKKMNHPKDTDCSRWQPQRFCCALLPSVLGKLYRRKWNAEGLFIHGLSLSRVVLDLWLGYEYFDWNQVLCLTKVFEAKRV